MKNWQDYLELSFMGNDLQSYLMVVGAVIVTYIIFRFVLSLILKHLSKWSSKTQTDLDDAIIGMLDHNRWFIFIVLVIASFDVFLKFSEGTELAINWTLIFFAVVLAIRLITYWIDYAIEKMSEARKQAAEKFSLQVIGKCLKVLTWVFGGVFLISAYGYNITSLVTGLGIGGIAIALAVQNILGDLISSVSIYLDKPFKVGDYIVVGNQMGTVKSIGLKTTRITSLQGEEIVMSNKKLTETDINNYGRMKKRRVVVSLGITYDTPIKKMKLLPKALQKIAESVEDTTFDRAHFKTFGDFSKVFELVFYVESKDYYTYMDRLQEINYKIEDYFEKHKIAFAFPSQTLYLKK